MNRLIRCLPLLAIALAACEGEVSPDARYRDGVMGAVGAHMGALGMLVGGQVDRPADIARHAHALRDLARSAHELFPEGSAGGEAKAEIWQQTDDFAAALGEFDRAAEALAEAASTGDREALGAAMKGLGGACKGCHDAFRE